MILKHIINLLKTEGFVYVTELGLFKKIFHEASTRGDQLIPPHNEVTLTEDPTGNGFALILAMTKEEGITIMAAEMEIKKWVENLRQELQQQEQVTINGFGTFSIKEGNISFQSNEIPFLNAEFEGMETLVEKKPGKQKQITIAEISTADIFNKPDPETVESTNIAEETTPEQTTDTPVAEETLLPNEADETPETPEIHSEEETITEEATATPEQTTGTPVAQEPLLSNEAEETTTPQGTKSKGAFIVLTFVVVALLLVGLFFKENIKSIYQQLRELRTTTIIDTIMVSPTIYDAEEDTLPEESIPTDTTTLLTAPQPEEPQQVVPANRNTEIVEMTCEPGKYYVIAGSFTTISEAKRHIQYRHLESYNPVILHQNGSQRVRVCIGIYASETEAQTYAKSINKDYWVLSN